MRMCAHASRNGMGGMDGATYAACLEMTRTEFTVFYVTRFMLTRKANE